MLKFYILLPICYVTFFINCVLNEDKHENSNITQKKQLMIQSKKIEDSSSIDSSIDVVASRNKADYFEIIEFMHKQHIKSQEIINKEDNKKSINIKENTKAIQCYMLLPYYKQHLCETLALIGYACGADMSMLDKAILFTYGLNSEELTLKLAKWYFKVLYYGMVEGKDIFEEFDKFLNTRDISRIRLAIADLKVFINDMAGFYIDKLTNTKAFIDKYENLHGPMQLQEFKKHLSCFFSQYLLHLYEICKNDQYCYDCITKQLLSFTRMVLSVTENNKTIRKTIVWLFSIHFPVFREIDILDVPPTAFKEFFLLAGFDQNIPAVRENKEKLSALFDSLSDLTVDSEQKEKNITEMCLIYLSISEQLKKMNYPTF